VKNSLKKDSLIIWGATGQSIVLEDFLKSSFEIKAIFDNNSMLKSPFDKIPLYYGEKGFKEWNNKNKVSNFIVAIGGNRGQDRVKISNYLVDKGLKPINAVNPKSILANNVDIGMGVQIMLGATIAARVKIGDYSIINTAASIDHESIIEKGCHIAPGVRIAGNVIVNEYSFLGIGAIVLPNIQIGKNCIVGAGSVVTKNIPDNSIVYGNPARSKGRI